MFETGVMKQGPYEYVLTLAFPSIERLTQVVFVTPCKLQSKLKHTSRQDFKIPKLDRRAQNLTLGGENLSAVKQEGLKGGTQMLLETFEAHTFYRPIDPRYHSPQ